MTSDDGRKVSGVDGRTQIGDQSIEVNYADGAAASSFKFIHSDRSSFLLLALTVVVGIVWGADAILATKSSPAISVVIYLTFGSALGISFAIPLTKLRRPIQTLLGEIVLGGFGTLGYFVTGANHYVAPVLVALFVLAGVLEGPGFAGYLFPFALLASIFPIILHGVSFGEALPGLIAVVVGPTIAEVVASSRSDRRATKDIAGYVHPLAAVALDDSFESLDGAILRVLEIVKADAAVVVLWDSEEGRRGEFYRSVPQDATLSAGSLILADRSLVRLAGRAEKGEGCDVEIEAIPETKPFFYTTSDLPTSFIEPDFEEFWSKRADVGDVLNDSLGLGYLVSVPLLCSQELEGVLVLEVSSGEKPDLSQFASDLFSAAASLAIIIHTRLKTDRLLAEASTDHLSGLANRRHFLTQMQNIDPADSVAFVDLDGFKMLNDTLGHHEGDTEISRFAVLLTSSLRSGDLASRYGGDEFAVIFKEADEVQVCVILDRIKRTWSSVGRTTFSAGVAQADGFGKPMDVLRRADLALYAAKRRGRNRAVASSALTHAEKKGSTDPKNKGVEYLGDDLADNA